MYVFVIGQLRTRRGAGSRNLNCTDIGEKVKLKNLTARDRGDSSATDLSDQRG
jgi:hypothetical protein